MRVILAKTTDAVAGDPIRVTEREYPFLSPPATLYLLGDALPGEIVVLEYPDDGDWRAVKVNGVGVALSAGTNILPVDAPVVFRVRKGVTTNPVGVAISHKGDI